MDNIVVHEICHTSNNKMVGGFSVVAPDGDEEVCGLFYCKNCNSYFLDCYHDEFIGDGDFIFQKQISDSDAKFIRNLDKYCTDPNRKTCQCKCHKLFSEYMYGNFEKVLKRAVEVQ